MFANLVIGWSLQQIPSAIKQKDGLAVLVLLGIVAVCVNAK